MFLLRPDIYNRTLGGIGFSAGTLTVKHIHSGDTARLPIDDPRIMSGEYVALNTGLVTVRNIITGKCLNISADDSRIGVEYEYVSFKKDHVRVRKPDGSTVLIKTADKKDDDNFVHIALTGYFNAYDISGKFIEYMPVDDVRRGVDAFGNTKNKVFILDEDTGKCIWIGSSDIRYQKYMLGEISNGQKGIKKIKDIECPHCNVIMDAANAHKWHFEFCKKNPNKIIRETKKDKCSICGIMSSPTIISQYHEQYCISNINRIDKKSRKKYITKEYVCDHCGFIGKQPNTMAKNHFNNCKERKY